MPHFFRPRNQRGAAVIEFAVIIPLLLFTLIGSVDVGRAVYEAIALSSAAHAGAQYGGITPENAGNTNNIRTAVLRNLTDSFGYREGNDHVDVVITRRCACGNGTNPGTTVPCETTTVCAFGAGAPRTYVRVSVTSNFSPLIPYPGLPSTFVISRTAEMRAS